MPVCAIEPTLPIRINEAERHMRQMCGWDLWNLLSRADVSGGEEVQLAETEAVLNNRASFCL